MEEKSKNLRVSDCHTAGFSMVDITERDGSYEKKKMYICDICKQECKVVEMIVEGIEPDES